MAIMNFLSDIRNAAIANAVIVVFHIYIAFAVEGVGFLIIVLPIGGLVAGAYAVKGKIGAGLLALPTLGYLFVFATNAPEMFESLKRVVAMRTLDGARTYYSRSGYSLSY